MPIYAYHAIDSQGKRRKGIIEAHNEVEAKKRLRDQGLMISKLSLKTESRGRENLKGEQLIAFTVQLSQLVNAGIPLYESLVTLEEQNRGETSHRILLSLCDQVKGGTPLSEAMARFPASFDRLYRSMIAAGEAAGALEAILKQIATFLTKQDKLKKEIGTALIYPSILAGFALLVISLLLGFVVPSIEGMFVERQLNGFTQFVISVSHIFRDYWWVYLPILLLAIIILVFWLKTEAGKRRMEKILLWLPITKTLLIQSALARFCRTMGTLQEGGLTMIESLKIAREVMENYTLEENVREAEEKMIEGSSLSKELSRSKWVPSMVSRMLRVSEETGSTIAMMNQIADIYEAELEKTISRLMALAQPVILIFMGVVIGTVMLAILLPLTDMSSFGL